MGAGLGDETGGGVDRPGGADGDEEIRAGEMPGDPYTARPPERPAARVTTSSDDRASEKRSAIVVRITTSGRTKSMLYKAR